MNKTRQKIDKAKTRIQDLSDALDGKDYERAWELAHLLKHTFDRIEQQAERLYNKGAKQ
jgi:exonuclease VII small subunit